MVEANVGVPQGSVWGPVLWNILCEGVLELELTENTVYVGFTDSVALVGGVHSNAEYNT